MTRTVTNKAPQHWQTPIAVHKFESWVKAARENHVRYRCDRCGSIIWFQKYTEQPKSLPCDGETCGGRLYVARMPGEKDIWERGAEATTENVTDHNMESQPASAPA